MSWVLSCPRFSNAYVAAQRTLIAPASISCIALGFKFSFPPKAPNSRWNYQRSSCLIFSAGAEKCCAGQHFVQNQFVFACGNPSSLLDKHHRFCTSREEIRIDLGVLVGGDYGSGSSCCMQVYNVHVPESP